MKSKALRKLYLDFFASKDHKIVPSAPIVVKNDPTLMFTNAGMNQFKHIFLGNTSLDYVRAANSQKCLRVSGKHNDLEEVGHDTYHHTMFEMLGSWSFGDYFKKEAIAWAWEFLTKVCKLDENRLYVTVFEGDKKEGLEKDAETFAIWKEYIAENKIINGNKRDNFWEMGDVGPCGPCTEIHYDNRPDNEREEKEGSLLINQDHPQVIEIWNLVFMQFNRFEDRSLQELPNRHVDTGMGFERLAMIMQGVESNYDTDIFLPLITEISKKANCNYGEEQKKDIAIRVIADHIRAIAFSIADGQLPSNTKGGYVIRRILRRAVRYGYTFLGLKQPFMHDLIAVLVNQFSDQYTELKSQEELISKVVREEEESFLRTLEGGLRLIDQMIAKSDGDISGKSVFELYDTFGFPVDLTTLILNEHKLTFNQEEFNLAMKEQKERSKQAGKVEIGDWKVLVDAQEEFSGYEDLEVKIQITRYRKIKSKDSQQYQLVFNTTPFYAEGGGQVGDRGFIINEKEKIAILDTKKENNITIHFTDKLPSNPEADFNAIVDVDRRKNVSRNHTATHLLHESLRVILGDHVTQKGSLVHPDYLRFDFSHFAKITKEELKNIELDVNSKILANISLEEHIDMPLLEAEELGAMMLFGEKYEDKVRMIQFNDSKELCGGTHVSSTGEIGLFKILSEGSISSGIRRIEAITGLEAFNYLNKKEELVTELSTIVKSQDLIKGVHQLINDNKELEKRLKSFKQANSANLTQDLLKETVDIGGVRFIAQEVDMDAQELKTISFSLRKEENLALVLGAKSGDKALLSVMLTDDLVEKGLDASVIIREIAKEINGGGGGQPFFATAGGSKPSGISKALLQSREFIQ
mgnify:CR=1 FL=1